MEFNIQKIIKYGQFLSILPVFLVFQHAFESAQAGDIESISTFFSIFIETSKKLETLSLAYISTVLIVSSIYSIIVTAPMIVPFFGLNDPVIAVSIAVFITSLAFDLMNSSEFSATKFSLGLFTGTLVKEKFKALSNSGESR